MAVIKDRLWLKPKQKRRWTDRLIRSHDEDDDGLIDDDEAKTKTTMKWPQRDRLWLRSGIAYGHVRTYKYFFNLSP